MADYIAPFDFKQIFVEYFLGSTSLFIYAFIIIFSFACAKLNMSNRIYIILLALCSLLFAGIMGEAFYIITILIVGLVSFKSIGRLLA